MAWNIISHVGPCHDSSTTFSCHRPLSSLVPWTTLLYWSISVAEYTFKIQTILPPPRPPSRRKQPCGAFQPGNRRATLPSTGCRSTFLCFLIEKGNPRYLRRKSTVVLGTELAKTNIGFLWPPSNHASSAQGRGPYHRRREMLYVEFLSDHPPSRVVPVLCLRD